MHKAGIRPVADHDSEDIFGGPVRFIGVCEDSNQIGVVAVEHGEEYVSGSLGHAIRLQVEGQVQVVYSSDTQQEVSVASPGRFGWLDGAIRVDDSPAQVGCQIDPVLDLPNEFVKHWAMEVRLGT